MTPCVGQFASHVVSAPVRVTVGSGSQLSEKAGAALAKAKRPADMHDFLCWQRLARVAPEPLRKAVETFLSEEAHGLIGSSKEQWETYSLRPYWAIKDQSDSLYASFQSALEANFNYEIDRQQEDGSWGPNWAWGQFEETWKVARREWSGHLTVKLLRQLQIFGRLET